MWPVKSSECFNKTDVMSQPASRRRHCACSLCISAGGCLRFNLTRMILHLNKVRLRRFSILDSFRRSRVGFQPWLQPQGLSGTHCFCSHVQYFALQMPPGSSRSVHPGWVDGGLGGVSYFRGQTQTSLIISVMHQIPGAPLNFRPA